MILHAYVPAIARLPSRPRPAPDDAPRAVTAPPRRAALRWLPAAAWATLLLTATSWPNPHVPAVRAGDKVVHLAMYAGLAWLTARALPAGAMPRRALGVAAAVSAFGAFDEWHQRYIPGRAAGVHDWAADTAGGALGAAAAAAHARRAAAARA
jgi:VanZ family protein